MRLHSTGKFDLLVISDDAVLMRLLRRHVLNEEDVNNSLTMIQPTLMSYTFDVPPVPVLLDSISIKPDVILLLDTFFHILIFRGRSVAQDQIPGAGRIRELQGAARGSGLQCSGEFSSYTYLLLAMLP